MDRVGVYNIFFLSFLVAFVDVSVPYTYFYPLNIQSLGYHPLTQ